MRLCIATRLAGCISDPRAPSRVRHGRDLAAGDYVTRAEPILLVGEAGTGKTHLATGLCEPHEPGSDQGRLRVERLALEGRDLDLPFPLACLGDVVAVLHPHERIHRDAEGLLNTQRHFRR